MLPKGGPPPQRLSQQQQPLNPHPPPSTLTAPGSSQPLHPQHFHLAARSLWTGRSSSRSVMKLTDWRKQPLPPQRSSSGRTVNKPLQDTISLERRDHGFTPGERWNLVATFRSWLIVGTLGWSGKITCDGRCTSTLALTRGTSARCWAILQMMTSNA